MATALHILPRRYLNTPKTRPNSSGMEPNDIGFDEVFFDAPEDRKAWRIAAMIHSANVLSDDGMHEAAQRLRIKAAALKFGVPDATADAYDDPTTETTIIVDVD